MSHRTAATALLLASSIPYGLALPQPQVIPFLSELDLGPTPEVAPPSLSLASSVPVPDVSSAADASAVTEIPSVTVVGTVVQEAVESFTDAIQDAIESVTSALESATAAVEDDEDVLPTGGPEVVDPEADILPLILPGILPVETDLPPVVDGDEDLDVETPDVDVPNVLFPDIIELPFEPSILLPNEWEELPETNDLEVIDLPPPNITLSEDDFPDVELEIVELPAPNVTLPAEDGDLPDTNELEVIDLPPPNTTVPEDLDIPTSTLDVLLPLPEEEDDLPIPTETPYGDDDLIAEPIPLFPDFPDEATVPFSTFNGVVQPLLSVIHVLLNSLPGNAAPPLPDIFIDPLLPTGLPDIFIDPLLPTEVLDDDLPAVSELVDPLFDLLVDPIPSPLLDVVNASDVPLAKRQLPVPVPLTTQGIFDLVASILQSINALVQAIPVVGPTVANIVDDVAGSVLSPSVEVPPVPLPSPIDVALPDVLDNGPAVPLPSPLDVEFPDVLLPEDPPVELPAPIVSNLPAALDDVPVPLPFPLDVAFPDVAPVDLPVPIESEVPEVVEDPNVLNNGPPVPLPFPLDVEFPDAPVEEPAIPIAPPALPVSNITLPILTPPSPPLAEVLPTDVPAEVPDVAVPEPELPSILPAPVDPASNIPSEVLDIPFPDDIEGIDWAAFESPPFSDLPETDTIAEELPIPDDVLNIPVPEFDENGNIIDTPVEAVPAVTAAASEAIPAVTSVAAEATEAAVTSVVAAAPPSLPTSLDAFGDLDFEDDLPDWPFTEIPETVTPDADGELPDLDDISEPAGLLLPLDAPTLAVPTDIVLAAPTSLFDVPVPEDFEDLDFPEPTAVASILPAAPSDDEFADIPADVWNIPWPDLDENGFPIDVPLAPSTGLPAAPAALPTDLNWLDIPVPDDWVDEDELPPTEAPTVALPEAPAALPTDLNILDNPVPDDFEDLVDPLPTAVLPPTAEDSAIPDDILNLPVPELGEDGLPIEEPAPALSAEAFGAGFPIQALPDVPLVLPTEDLLPVEGAAALTEAVSAVPTDAISGLPTGVVSDAIDAVPTIAINLPFRPLEVPSVPAPLPPVAAPTVATPEVPALIPRLPFQVPGSARSVEKRQLPNWLRPRPTVARPLPSNVPGVTIIKPVFDLISSLLTKLGIDATQVPNLAAALSLAPALPPVLPIPGVPTVSDIAEIVEDVASVVDSVTSVLPLPTLPSILPLPLVLPPLPDVEDVLSTVTDLPVLPPLPDLEDILSTVTDLPVVQPTRPVAAVLPVVPTPAIAVAPLATAVGGSRRARRAMAEMQQGPASDWESFLGELGESYQSELAGLIQDSAQAVNEDALDDSFAETLQSDFEDLSDSTKAQLVEGFATTFGKRDMRHGKRQAAPPGALSIGPNLDDADKVDLSSILGQTGSLDPFNQAFPASSFPGSPVDGARPVGIRPRPVDTFDALPDSSVSGSTANPELAAILAAGGLDPNGMLSQIPDDDTTLSQPLEDPYADIRAPWDTALDASQPAQALEGLRETLQASKNNHIGSRVSRESSGAGAPASFRNAVAQPSSVLAASQNAEQRNVLLWFHRYVKPSWNKDVDAEIEFT
ncbi:hypothetical protein SVAN01_05251 [Stagonosporopsis vannaccii]|nr:hypothetical protein SVAN01_05251 [Stagonosporopsis vannaccii]